MHPISPDKFEFITGVDEMASSLWSYECQEFLRKAMCPALPPPPRVSQINSRHTPQRIAINDVEPCRSCASCQEYPD